MPLKRIKFEYKGLDYALTPEELLDFAKKRPDRFPYTYEVLAVLLGGQQDRGEHLSTTALLTECDRNLVLERLTPFTDTLDHLWASFTGTMFHSQLEQARIPGQTVLERRFWMDYEGLGWLSCKPDLIDRLHGLMEDYKSKEQLPRFDYPYKKDETQLQFNRFIVDHASYVECEGDEEPDTVIHPPGPKQEEGVRVRAVRSDERPDEWTELAVVYLAPREGMKRIPIMESIEVPKKTGPGTKKKRVPSVWSDSRVEEYIEEQYAAKRKALDTYKARRKLPPVPEGWEGLTGWLCGYCPVRAACLDNLIRGR